MSTSPGLVAFETFVGLSMHFRRESYDGWKYNFKTRAAEAMFKKDIQLKYAYEFIERNHATLQDRIRFMYPLFKRYGAFVKPTQIMQMRHEHKKFEQFIADVVPQCKRLLAAVKKEVHDKETLLSCTQTLPRVYELYNDGVIDDDQAVLLFMLIPGLNSTSSKEPFVFDKWKQKIQFDKAFFSLYIPAPLLIELQVLANDTFNQ